jgi:D-erythro-7,8-dihydroneopterin triphosphate epimerase
MTIRIKNLRLRAIIGVHEWERKQKQDILVNLALEFDGGPAARSDDLRDSVDYAAIKHRLLEKVEQTQFLLLERLVEYILDLVMEEPRVQSATVEVDKPHALRFADSVSMTSTRRR